MIPTVRSHQDYLQFVIQTLNQHYGDSMHFLQDFFAETILWTTSMDLTMTMDLMKDRYSAKAQGRKPHDPANLLQSIFLMTKLHMSVDQWVYVMRITPIYAILSGFPPGKTPGVGTFYDFFRRLWLTDSPHLTKRIKRKLRKPRKKGKKNEKQEPKNPKITEKLVARALRSNRIHYTLKAHDQLQRLLSNLICVSICHQRIIRKYSVL